MKIRPRYALVVGLCIGAATAFTAIALGSPGAGFVATILGTRASLAQSVHLNTDRIKFQTKDATDLQMQTITYHPHAFSGWHYHPGFVLVIVQSGQLTLHDGNCHTTTKGPHEAFVEYGTDPFMVSNDSNTTDAVVYAAFVAPAGSPFRVETNVPSCAA